VQILKSMGLQTSQLATGLNLSRQATDDDELYHKRKEKAGKERTSLSGSRRSVGRGGGREQGVTAITAMPRRSSLYDKHTVVRASARDNPARKTASQKIGGGAGVGADSGSAGGVGVARRVSHTGERATLKARTGSASRVRQQRSSWSSYTNDDGRTATGSRNQVKRGVGGAATRVGGRQLSRKVSVKTFANTRVGHLDSKIKRSVGSAGGAMPGKAKSPGPARPIARGRVGGGVVVREKVELPWALPARQL
jgi:hypothetical protein